MRERERQGFHGIRRERENQRDGECEKKMGEMETEKGRAGWEEKDTDWEVWKAEAPYLGLSVPSESYDQRGPSPLREPLWGLDTALPYR